MMQDHPAYAPERKRIRQLFGATITSYRKRRHMTQEWVALEAGVGLCFMSNLENGKHCPSLSTIFKIIDALGVSFADFAAEIQRRREQK
jgi:putative transcriptional regulator